MTRVRSNPPSAHHHDEFAGHTPGPWVLREFAHEATPWSKRRVYRVEVAAPQFCHGKLTHHRLICQFIDYCDWTDHPANAALVAAAPDLLAENERLRAALAAQAERATRLWHVLKDIYECPRKAERMALDALEYDASLQDDSAALKGGAK